MVNGRVPHGGFTRAHLRRDAGSSLVEAAVVMPFLAMVLLGVIELGWGIYAAIEASNAAKAGVQYGAQNASTVYDTTGITTAATNDAYNLTGLDVTVPAPTCVCSDGTTSTCQNTDCPNSHIVMTRTVQTQATVTPPVHLPGLPATFTFNGKAMQKVLQ
jgi:Flp pilus assembly protein TadG